MDRQKNEEEYQKPSRQGSHKPGHPNELGFRLHWQKIPADQAKLSTGEKHKRHMAESDQGSQRESGRAIGAVRKAGRFSNGLTDWQCNHCSRFPGWQKRRNQKTAHKEYETMGLVVCERDEVQHASG